jgi:hypothetical protein
VKDKLAGKNFEADPTAKGCTARDLDSDSVSSNAKVDTNAEGQIKAAAKKAANKQKNFESQFY